ncbi:MAG: hypothetical protein KF861_08280, partial [Planctomycetaceae bacterium]|nr:hypothetical protein [Planctomycetaceae bacterium]
AHELAHLVRSDVVWLWIGRLLTAAFGWQPLNHVAVRGWREASEQLSDDWAVAGGVEPLTLARCLTQVAEWRLDRAAHVPGLTVIGRRSRLASRIERLVGPPRVDRWQSAVYRRLLAACVVTAAGLLVWTGPRLVIAQAKVAAPETVVTISEADDFASPLNEATLVPAETIATSDSLAGELDALRRDLQLALELLAQSEPDPDIAALAEQILQRIKALDDEKLDRQKSE